VGASFQLVAYCFVLILVATALLARDHAAVVTINRGGHRAAVTPRELRRKVEATQYGSSFGTLTLWSSNAFVGIWYE
jgi:hypothetical protein